MNSVYRALSAMGISWASGGQGELAVVRERFHEHVSEYGYSYGTKEEY